MVRRRFRPLLALAAVIAAAGSVTAAGLTFTAHTASRTVAELPTLRPVTLPSYVVRLPEPAPVPTAPLISQEASVTPSPAAEVPATAPAILTAEVTPLAADTVEVSATGGSAYIVSSDVYVRSGPAKQYDQLGTARGGTELTVTAEQDGWMQVSFDGGSGWIYQRYLVPAEGETVAEADTGSVAPF